MLGAELVELNRYAMGPEASQPLVARLADLRATLAALALRPSLNAAPQDLLRADAAVAALRNLQAQAPAPATREALMIALHLRETLAEDRLSEPPPANPDKEPAR